MKIISDYCAKKLYLYVSIMIPKSTELFFHYHSIQLVCNFFKHVFATKFVFFLSVFMLSFCIQNYTPKGLSANRIWPQTNHVK